MKYKDHIFLSIADRIGKKICEQAFWFGSQCNWMGRQVDNSSTDTFYSLKNNALGPELYDGSSGISLFLSYLYKYTGNEEYLKTAEGAISHALLHTKSIPFISRFGCYTGNIGIAYIATKIGNLLKNDLFIERSLDLSQQMAKDKGTKHWLDMISGNAGAIPALLNMNDVFHDKNLYELALYLGNELLSSSIKENVGRSWNHIANGIVSVHHNLTGFSHGAAGIGYGLLELYRRTDIVDFRIAAEEAISYENQWFDSQYKNWPDFRMAHGSKNNQGSVFNYAAGWCHGAPGIGLSRLHAYHVLKDEKYLKDCQAALFKSMSILRSDEALNYRDYSLCHGLSGIAELLICTSLHLRNDSYKSVAINLGVFGANTYGNFDSAWPCGLPGCETPGLMLGLSGIGYFYLRLYDSLNIPSILMP